MIKLKSGEKFRRITVSYYIFNFFTVFSSRFIKRVIDSDKIE